MNYDNLLTRVSDLVDFLAIIIICITFTSLLKLIYDWDDIIQEKGIKEKFVKCLTISKVTGLIFALVFITGIGAYQIERSLYGTSLFHALNLALVIMLVIPLVYRDITEQIIPNKFIVAGLAVRFTSLVLEFFFAQSTQYNLVLSSLAGLLFGGGIFLLSAFLIKNSVGMGDVKLFAVIGFFVGLSGIFSVLFYSLLSSVITGVFLITIKKKDRKDYLPLAPFAMIGLTLSIVLGI